MESLCEGNAFWDSDLTWTNNSWPELTECFEHTALSWVPCGYLLIVAPFYLTYLVTSSPSRPSSYSRLFVLKQIFAILMVGLLIAGLSESAHHVSHFNDEILYYTTWIVVMILHIFVVCLERSRMLRRFPVLFTFWLLGSTTLLFQLYSAIQRESYDSDPFHFTMLVIRYILAFILFILHCFSSHRRSVLKDGASPIMVASLPSLLFLYWMEPLVIKGFKKPLQHEDLYSLMPDNRTFNVMEKFEKRWEQEKNSCKGQRRKLKKRKPAKEVNGVDIPLQSPLQEDKKDEQKEAMSEEDCFVKPSFTKALVKNFYMEAIKTQVGQIGRLADNVLSPLVLGLFIDYISNNELTWHGYVYTAAILLLKVAATGLTHPSTYLISMLALRAQSSTMGSVLKKSLTVSGEARKESTTGEIVNLMSSDANRIRIMCDYMYWWWLSIVFFIIGIAFTSSLVGVALLPGMAVIVLVLVMNVFVLNIMTVYEAEIMGIKDERVKVMNEILNGIKVIKLYGWETTFINKILTIREKELKILRKKYILEALFNFAWRGALFWMNFFILVVYVMTDENHYLDARRAFVTLTYINLVRLAVNITPILAQDIIKARTALRRVNKFMNAEDISPINLERDETDSFSVRIVEADFAWEKHGRVTLKSVDLEVKPGRLIAVVGTVGSGKSSLLSAMLGEMHKLKGYANLNSSVAYVPQQAWIQNATIKNNILFGSPCKKAMYDDVIKNCCLEADLEILQAGDETEIGEKGINLSGGQKQRVSLARAVYSQADIFLLDDPLSAVDSHVGRHIFDQVIGPNGCLRGKTRIFVTHGVQWLPYVDQIIVMANGEISESGSFDELLAQNGDFSQFLTQYFIQHGDLLEDADGDANQSSSAGRAVLQRLVSVVSADSELSEGREVHEPKRFLSVEHADDCESSLGPRGLLLHSDISLSHSSLQMISHEREGLKVMDEDMRKPDASRLTTDEGADGGTVEIKMYWYLLKGMGVPFLAIIAFFVMAYHVTFNFANWWIAEWNDDPDLSNFSSFPANSSDRLNRNTYYIVSFTIIGIVQSVSVLVYSAIFFVRHVTSCRKLHARLLQTVMQAPMHFFDTTPIGRILNRFSQDMEDIDNDIILNFVDVVEFALKAIGILITISATLPWFLVVVLPLVIIVLIIQRLYIVNSCQVRRLTSSKRSPIFAHFSETLTGASVIRAYRAQDQFINESNAKIDSYQRAETVARGFHRWAFSRLDVSTYLVVGSVCLFAVLMRNDLTSGVIGLAVTYAFEMGIQLCLCVELYGMLATNLVAVERIREYSVIKSEAAWTTPEDSQHSNDEKGAWPSVGKIEFVEYSTRYREGLDLVLKNIDCVINGGEKIGIVGRTGAGKSSMVLSIFRLIEAVRGRIVIDGVDISQIGLHTLRHKITILPQDPVLFAGSLRSNLDPQEEKTDSEIWTALEHSHLKDFVMSLDDKLYHTVGEGGENLSMGQRQLVCLARTLLRKTKILILDEATAAVDMDTDDLIQKTIRTEFSDCTVLAIAHRLNTILDYDRIMVLESGNVREFESPSILLSDPSSVFYSMAKDAGLVGNGKDT